MAAPSGIEPESTGIVENGRERALSAARDRVVNEVEAEYEEELRKAGPWRRLLLLWEMHREIERRLRHIAPPDGLYSRNT
jgi:hypothetical protein